MNTRMTKRAAEIPKGVTGIDCADCSNSPARFNDGQRVLKFRHLLERHALTQEIFKEIDAHLNERNPLMREGTIIDATICTFPQPLYDRAQKNGRTVISMKYDWKRIFAFEK